MASQNPRTAKAEAQARLREKKKEYVEKLEHEIQQFNVILGQLALMFGISTDELVDLPQILERTWTSDTTAQSDISDFFLSLTRLRCRLLFSGSIQAGNHPPHKRAVSATANDSSSAWTAPLDGVQVRQPDRPALNLRFVLHMPYEPV